MPIALAPAPPPVTPDVRRRAELRARGDDRAVARTVAQAVLAQPEPAQITIVRCDRAAAHVVCGVVLSGRKFKHPLDRAGFLAEVERTIRAAFGAAPIDEVDLWTTVPVAAGHGAVVSGDFAQPTSATVFAVTVPRSALGELHAQLASGRDVFWDPAFADQLARSAS